MTQTRYSSDWSLPEALPEALAIYTKTNEHRITTTERALNEMAPERSRLAQEADALSRSAFYFNDNARPQMRAIAKANSHLPLDWREWAALTPQLKQSEAKTADDWTLATKYDGASAKCLRSTNRFMLQGIAACLGANAANIATDKLLFSNTATSGRTGVIDFVAASAGCLLSRSWIGAATTMVASHLAARIIDQSDQR